MATAAKYDTTINERNSISRLGRGAERDGLAAGGGGILKRGMARAIEDINITKTNVETRFVVAKEVAYI